MSKNEYVSFTNFWENSVKKLEQKSDFSANSLGEHCDKISQLREMHRISYCQCQKQ